jgi:tetratricopeptide (TPR) repeat protein
MSEAGSHKSFRPVTTATFRLNWVVSEMLGTNKTIMNHTYGFKLVNLALHGFVSALVTEASGYVFVDEASTVVSSANQIARLVTGLLFGLHPVHAEVVSNITSRGELLMSIFFLLSFLSFASQVYSSEWRDPRYLTWSIRRCICIYILPWMFTTLSLFSKEQGATTLMSLVMFDFIQNHVSLKDYVKRLSKRDPYAIVFFKRTVILALETIVLCSWRYWLNGETLPDFIPNQNPAGFAQDRFTRVFSVSWVYCLYIRDALLPIYLCPDWSGLSIPLIENMQDRRAFLVMLLWSQALAALWSTVYGFPMKPKPTLRQYQRRRISLVAVFSFLFFPFLLSSNLVVTVGLMKADRVIYLPLMGFCILEALLLKYVFYDTTKKPEPSTTTSFMCVKLNCLAHAFVLAQLAFFCARVHERNLAWSSALNLWAKAYDINPRSHHTIYNFGYELSLKRRYAEAEYVLRPIADPTVDGPSNTFVFAMILYNLDRCDEARTLLDRAMDVLEQKKVDGGVRNTRQSTKRIESNILVARAFCTSQNDIQQAGKLMYQAVETDPTNDYAIQQATNMVDHLQKLQTAQLL